MWWRRSFFLPGEGECCLRKKLAALAVGLALLLAACRGAPLPEGMEEDRLLSAGREVLAALVSGDYETVCGMLRPDVAAEVSEEELRSLMLRQLDGAGVYKQIESSMVTGQSSDGEDYGVAVLYCEFDRKDAVFRLAFDPDYALIGLEVKQQ